jgi:hypothetical protein
MPNEKSNLFHKLDGERLVITNKRYKTAKIKF